MLQNIGSTPTNLSKMEDTSAIKQKRIYVLVPLPSNNLDTCTTAYPYVQTSAAVNNKLTRNNFIELKKLGNDLLNRLTHTQAKKANVIYPIPLTFNDTATLQNLKKEDVLYIVAHGSPSSIGTQKGGIDLSPTLLVATLLQAGLSATLGTLKIMACDSATDKNNIDVYGPYGNPPQLSGNGISYAEMTAQELQRNNFLNTSVKGYIGETVDVKEVKNHRDLHTFVKFESQLIRASNAGILFPALNLKANPKKKIEEKNAETIDLMRTGNIY